MDTLLIILILGGGVYFFVKKFSSGQSIRSSKIFSKIPKTALNKAYDNFRGQLISGEAAQQLNSSIILKRNEVLVFEIPGIQLCEERTVKTKGSHQGFSIRIMKGVSYRFGGFEAAAQKEVVELDVGTLTLTNKRLMFSGSRKSVDYSISKINRIEALEDGVSISRARKVRVEYFLGTTNLSLRSTIAPAEGESFEPEEVTYEFSGQECKTVLKRLIQQLN